MPENQPEKTRRPIFYLIMVGIAIIFLIIAAAVYYLFATANPQTIQDRGSAVNPAAHSQVQQAVIEQNPQAHDWSKASSTPSLYPIALDTQEKWIPYTNDALHIKFEYPAEWGSPIIENKQVDMKTCEAAMMKTYLPEFFSYTTEIQFTNRQQNDKGLEPIRIGLVKFSASKPQACSDLGLNDMTQRQKQFMTRSTSTTTDPYFGAVYSKTDQGNVFSYYPNLYDSIGTSFLQVYEMYGPETFVQADIWYAPRAGSPEADESNLYGCSGPINETCGFSRWLREGKTAASLRRDFARMDHLIRSFSFTQ